jgi:hypothetical protein
MDIKMSRNRFSRLKDRLKKGRFGLAAGIFCLLLSALILYGGLNILRTSRTLAEHGQLTQGRAGNKWMAGGKGQTEYTIFYTFEVNGHHYEGRNGVLIGDYVVTKLGSPISVRYLLDDPGISQLAISTDSQDAWERVLVIGAIFGVMGIAIILMVFYCKT